MPTPQTRVIGGTGQSTAEYVLPPGVYQYIESVLIEVDTSGSGDVQPTLSVMTQDRYPIADKTQGQPLDGGGSGRATWALRLNDETTGVGTGFIRFDFDNQGGYLDITANNTDANGHGIYLNDDTGVDGMLLEAEERVTIQQQDGKPRLIVNDDSSGLTFESNHGGMAFDDTGAADPIPRNGFTFTTGDAFNVSADAGAEIDTAGSDVAVNTNGGNVRFSSSDGAGLVGDYYFNWSDSDPVSFRFDTSGGIFYVDLDTGNCTFADTGAFVVAGETFKVETTDDDSGVGIRLHDQGLNGSVDIASDNGNIANSAGNEWNAGTPGFTLALGPNDGAQQILNAGGTFVIYDHLGNPLVTYTG